MGLRLFKIVLAAFLGFSVASCTVEKRDKGVADTKQEDPNGNKGGGENGNGGTGGNTGGNASGGKLEIIRSQYKDGEITSLCDQAITELKDKLTNKTKDVLDFEQHLADHGDKVSPLTFMSYVSTDEKLREEGSACEEKNGQLMVELFTTRDLYEKLKKSVVKTDEEKRLLSETLRGFEKNGMSLDDASLKKFKDYKTELTSLETQFSANLNNDQTKIELTEKELEGTSAAFIARLAKSADGTKLIVTTKSTDYTEVMDNAKNPDTRKAMLSAYESRQGAKNSDLLKRAETLRRALAHLMNQRTWADYQTSGRMAKSSGNVLSFLNDLKTRLQPRLKKDFDLLLEAKKQMQDPSATELKAWDIRYFLNQVKKRDYSIDDEVIREYFPKDVVMKGMFEVYSTLLGVTYNEVNAEVWSPDVKLYSVTDKKSGQLIAYFYTDFVPRVGKYGHAAAFPLISGRKLANGAYSIPVASIVANFNPPANGKPSLLSHDEVETTFHEFGHIMHQVLTRAPYASLSGSSVAQDYVEAPSQMLENWVWDSEILEKISGHYKDNAQLPASLRKKMVEAKDFGQGYFYSRQLVFGLTDMLIHTSNTTLDPNAAYVKTHTEIMGIEPVQGTQFMASFGHMMGGYDAGYYGYIWSEVYATDMFTAFAKDGLLNETVGGRYRATILEQGSMLEPQELLTQFLGRAPNNDAFLKKLGL